MAGGRTFCSAFFYVGGIKAADRSAGKLNAHHKTNLSYEV